MAKVKFAGEVVAIPATDDLTLERVQQWLRERAAGFRGLAERYPIAFGANPPGLASALEVDIERVCSRLNAAGTMQDALQRLDDVFRTSDAPHPAERPAAPRATTATGRKPNRGERWRKRPLSEKERDDLRMELLRARATGPEALARVKREIGKRHGLHPRWVASLLNTCVGKRYALNFAARVVSRASQAQRRAQLVVQLANLLGLRRDRILRAVRELSG